MALVLERLRRRLKPSPRVVCPAVRFSIDSQDWAAVFRHLSKPAGAPVVSIITPLFNTKPQWLAEAAVSVFDQTCRQWEWVLVDDGSNAREFEGVLAAILQASPANVRFLRLPRNVGISAASNEGLRLARGEFACFLDHDDLLEPEALEICLGQLRTCDGVYTDSDKAGEDGVCDEPFHKPGWSPEFFRHVMYVGHLLCVRRQAALTVGGFDSRFDGVQDFEFFLRYSERFGRIAHVPRILYHWRRVKGSVAAALAAKPGIGRLQREAVSAQLQRLHLRATAVEGPGAHRVTVVPEARERWPEVAVNFEGAGAFVLFLSPDVEPVSAGWMNELLYYAEQGDVGAVGPLIVNSDGSIRHSGIAVGGPAVASHLTAKPALGDHAHECSAVSGACLMIRRDLFLEAGGFNKHYAVAYSDVDLCLRLMAMGKRNICAPRAVVRQNGAVPDDPFDRALLLDEWEELIEAGDAFYDRAPR